MNSLCRNIKTLQKDGGDCGGLGLIGGIVPSPPDVSGSAEREAGQREKEEKKGRDESGISRVETQPGWSNPVL